MKVKFEKTIIFIAYYTLQSITNKPSDKVIIINYTDK